jgi:hypothetical protein
VSQTKSGPDIIQVCLHPVLRSRFEAWLDVLGLEMWRMPDFSDDDLPTYGVKPKGEPPDA